MRPRLISVTAGLALLTVAGGLQAQVTQRRATMRGGNRPGVGKCTVEVVVDGAAQVEIRGDVATLRNLNGQPPQWRRFECDSVMPNNPANFRFVGVDGRGRQTLINDPRNGAAVVQIEDPDNGSQGYTFDITWGNDSGYQNGGYQTGNGYPNGVNRGVSGGYGNGNQNGYPQNGGGQRYTTQQAVQVCQDAIRDQARNQYRSYNLAFRDTRLDDQPGGNDSVVGSVEIRNPQSGYAQIARFSCSVNFDNGRVRSARLEQPHWNGANEGYGSQRMPDAAIQNCQRAVVGRLRTDGYERPQFGNLRVDDQPGRSDWVVGSVRATGRYGEEDLKFSCSVDLRDGDIRSIDIATRR